MNNFFKNLILFVIFVAAPMAFASQPACAAEVRAAMHQAEKRRQHNDNVTHLEPPEDQWQKGSVFVRVRDEEHSTGMSGSRFYRLDRTLVHPDFGEIEVVFDDASDSLSHFSALLLSLKPRRDELPPEFLSRQQAFFARVTADYPILGTGIVRAAPLMSEYFIYRFPADARGGNLRDLEVPRSWSQENRYVLKLSTSQSGVLFDFTDTAMAKREAPALHSEFFERLLLSADARAMALNAATLGPMLAEKFNVSSERIKTHEFLVTYIGKGWIDLARRFDDAERGTENYNAVLGFVASLDTRFVNPFIQAMRDHRVRDGFFMANNFSASGFISAMKIQLGIP